MRDLTSRGFPIVIFLALCLMTGFLFTEIHGFVTDAIWFIFMADLISCTLIFGAVCKTRSHSIKTKPEARESNKAVSLIIALLGGLSLFFLVAEFRLLWATVLLTLLAILSKLLGRLRVLFVTTCGVAIITGLASLALARHPGMIGGFLGLIFLWFLPIESMLLILGLVSESGSRLLGGLNVWRMLALTLTCVLGENAWILFLSTSVFG